jgi:hypothetical protein
MKTRDLVIVCGTAIVVAYLVASPFRWKLGERRHEEGREPVLGPQEAAARNRHAAEEARKIGLEAARLKFLGEHEKAGTTPTALELLEHEAQLRAFLEVLDAARAAGQ